MRGNTPQCCEEEKGMVWCERKSYLVAETAIYVDLISGWVSCAQLDTKLKSESAIIYRPQHKLLNGKKKNGLTNTLPCPHVFPDACSYHWSLWCPVVVICLQMSDASEPRTSLALSQNSTLAFHIQFQLTLATLNVCRFDFCKYIRNNGQTACWSKRE